MTHLPSIITATISQIKYLGETKGALGVKPVKTGAITRKYAAN